MSSKDLFAYIFGVILVIIIFSVIFYGTYLVMGSDAIYGMIFVLFMGIVGGIGMYMEKRSNKRKMIK